MKKPDSWKFDVDESSFDVAVLAASRNIPILVDFLADWCAPCFALAPSLDGAVDDMGGRIHLAKVEVDENMRLAGHIPVEMEADARCGNHQQTHK